MLRDGDLSQLRLYGLELVGTYCLFSTKKEMIKNLVDISSTKADNEGGREKTFTTFTFVKVSGRRSSADPGFH